MRELNGVNDGLTIHVLDEPGHGGACHTYIIRTPNFGGLLVIFQNGPIAEVGVNGITHEALLAILIDRLEGFQAGEYACNENEVALSHIRTAQTILKYRTEKRLARGVEGTRQV